MLMISTYTLYVEVILIAILYLGKHYTKGPLIKNKKFNLLCSNFVSLQIFWLPQEKQQVVRRGRVREHGSTCMDITRNPPATAISATGDPPATVEDLPTTAAGSARSHRRGICPRPPSLTLHPTSTVADTAKDPSRTAVEFARAHVRNCYHCCRREINQRSPSMLPHMTAHAAATPVVGSIPVRDGQCPPSLSLHVHCWCPKLARLACCQNLNEPEWLV